MEQPLVAPTVPPSERVDLIGQISNGMKVYDMAGKVVGHVDGTYGGARGESVPAAVTVINAPAAAPVTGQQPVPIVEAVSAQAKVPVFDHALDTDEDLPAELRERLEHDGFIRIDAGFLKHHRYALRDQIARVDEGVVALNILAEYLIKH